MPLVSVVTPSFNQAAYLEQTLRSVLEQDYADIEYIVIDGSSTDGSVELIKKYASRLSYWVSEKDSGQAEAINKGMQRAHGEIVAWLNSDDYYLPGAVSAAVKAFEQDREALLVYSNILAVDADGQIINHLTYRPLTLQDLLCFEIIGQPAVFMRRAAFEQTGGLDPSYHFLLDHHLWIRIAAQGRLLYVPQTWAAARYHAAAKNRASAAEFGDEAFRILNWARSRPDLAPWLGSCARAAAHRVNARYLLDGQRPWSALWAWTRAFLIYPPVALKRLNILASALLSLAGLGKIRQVYLTRRRLNR
ncbi:MAG: glycosyltransferase family 2 protein [Candidatus Villigracilaceae bacterium]